MALEPSRLSKAAATLSHVVRLVYLGGASVAALAITALNIANANTQWTSSVAAVALLTFLVCHIIVTVSPPVVTVQSAGPSNADPSIAHFLVRAGTASRTGSMLLLAFSCAWLYNLMAYAFLLLFATIFGVIMGFTIAYGEPVPADKAAFGSDDASSLGNETTELAPLASKPDAFAEFQRQTGIDPAQVIRRFSPVLLLCIITVIWFNFLSLCLFVLSRAWRSLWAVLSSPASDLIRKDEVALGNADVKEEAVAVQDRVVVDGWHKM